MILNLFLLIVALLITNLIFASFLMSWVTDDDMNGLRKPTTERYTDLVYFSIVSFSTAGYGDISPKSSRAKIAISTYLMFVNIAAVYGIYNAIAGK
jgi:hypothetical protein